MEIPVLGTISHTLLFYLLRIVAAVVVLFVGRYLAGKARIFTSEVIKRPEVDEALSSSIESILVRAAYYGTLFLSFILALVILGVPATAVFQISSAVLVILAVALRESLSNFAAAVMFLIYQPFRIGEEIETMGRRGIVREMQLFSTVLMQPDRSLAILPNGDIQKDGIINYTRLGISRVDLKFTLKYKADVEKARLVIMKIMTNDARVLKQPPPAMVIMEMGDNGLEMQARPFVRYEDYDPVQFGFRQLITEKLIAAGIEPAVTQHDVQLDPNPVSG
jgi:small conductance mechanosensitive channel